MREASRGRWFTVAQLIRLIEDEGFGFNAVQAVQIFAPRLLDKTESGFKLYAKVTFDSDKQQVKAALEAP